MTMPWKTAKDVLGMWKRDEYDNLKDVIQDCQYHLQYNPDLHDRKLRSQLEGVLREATRALQQMIESAPALFAGWETMIDPKYLKPSRRGKTKTKTKTRPKPKKKTTKSGKKKGSSR